MGYNCKILADSINAHKVRITTFELTFPRIILSEFNTHRVFCRNSQSSRACPIEKMIKRAVEDTFVPFFWGANQSGMVAELEISEEKKQEAIAEWLKARDSAVEHVKNLSKIGVHKQLTNRLLEPWQYQTVILTSTEFSNWYALRRAPDAQPEIKKIADMMFDCHLSSTPQLIIEDDWHLPLCPDFEELQKTYDISDIIKIVIGRCARVSYMTHDGKRDPQADIDLYERLLKSRHMSPFEHVATPMSQKHADEINSHSLEHYSCVEEIGSDPQNTFCGPLRSWVSKRMLLQNLSR